MTGKLRVPVVLSFVVSALVAVGYLGVLLYNTGGLPSFKDKYEIRAVVPSAMSLAEGSGVRIAGIEAGKVLEVERVGLGTVVRMRVDDDQAPVPVDSTIAVRLRSLIGESYVEILPGRSASMLQRDGTVPADQTSQYVEVEEVLDEFKGTTRTGARRLFQGLGKGLDGRGADLNRVVGGLSASVEDSAPIFGALADRRTQVSRLIDQFGAISRTVGAKGDGIEALARETRSSFAAIARRDDAVREILTELPNTLGEVRQASGVLRRVSGNATPVVARLARAVDALHPAVSVLQSASREGEGVLREVSRGEKDLRGTLRSLRRLSGPAAQALPLVKGALCEVNPMLEYLSPYHAELASFFQNTASGTNFYDATGHAARLSVLVGEASFGGVDDKLNEVLKAVTSSQLVAPLHQIGYNPYPAPGKGGATETGRSFTGPKDAQGAISYPRVQADC